MGKELYTWEQVRAYGEIALHNLTKSAIVNRREKFYNVL